jgi:hypothetical protein
MAGSRLTALGRDVQAELMRIELARHQVVGACDLKSVIGVKEHANIGAGEGGCKAAHCTVIHVLVPQPAI